NFSSVSSPITLNSELPNINHNVNLIGPGANQLTVQRSTAGGIPDFRIILVLAGRIVTMSGLTITNGRAPSPNSGGGIANNGTLTLTDCVVSNNTGQDGGGLLNNGSVAIVNSSFTGNSTGTGSGGAIESIGTSNTSFLLVNSTLANNTS